jgi:hypothetical protein
MVAVEMDMVVTTAMVIILQGLVTLVVDNLLQITNVIMLIDTSHMRLGVQEEMALDKVTEVLEVEKV